MKAISFTKHKRLLDYLEQLNISEDPVIHNKLVLLQQMFQQYRHHLEMIREAVMNYEHTQKEIIKILRQELRRSKTL